MKGKILVTGGAGYIGSTLVGMLLSKGYKVRAVDNLMYDTASLLPFGGDPDFEFIDGDLTDPRVRQAAVDRVDAIVHLAAIVGERAFDRDPALSMLTNYDATTALVDLAHRRDVRRFIFGSTCSNYGVRWEDGLCKEEDPLNPVSGYAVSKVRSEEYILDRTKNGFVPTILRFSTVFGVSSRMRFDLLINHFTKDAVTRRKVVVYGDQCWRPYLHVGDIGRAIMLVVEADKALVQDKVFNVGGQDLNYCKRAICDLVGQGGSRTSL